MIKEILANNIKRFRKIRGLTQANLGLRCGIGYYYLSDIEQAKKNITIEVVEKIAIGLEVEVEDLFKHKEYSLIKLELL